MDLRSLLSPFNCSGPLLESKKRMEIMLKTKSIKNEEHISQQLLLARARRDHFVIMADILSLATSGLKKTELMYKAGLSSTQLSKYMLILSRSELLEASNRNKETLYKTTAKGEDFLQRFRELVKLLD